MTDPRPAPDARPVAGSEPNHLGAGPQLLRRSGGRNDREVLLEELWFWLEGLLGWLPGRVGRLVRSSAYRPFLRADGAVDIAEHTHIRMPWKLRCGRQVSIGRGSQLTCTEGIVLGDDVLIGPGVLVVSNNHVFTDPTVHIRDQGLAGAPVTIGDDVWLGAHAVVLPGVTIGAGAVVAAGAVVTDDVDPATVVGGIPARPIRRRGPTPPA